MGFPLNSSRDSCWIPPGIPAGFLPGFPRNSCCDSHEIPHSILMQSLSEFPQNSSRDSYGIPPKISTEFFPGFPRNSSYESYGSSFWNSYRIPSGITTEFLPRMLRNSSRDSYGISAEICTELHPRFLRNFGIASPMTVRTGERGTVTWNAWHLAALHQTAHQNVCDFLYFNRFVGTKSKISPSSMISFIYNWCFDGGV